MSFTRLICTNCRALTWHEKTNDKVECLDCGSQTTITASQKPKRRGWNDGIKYMNYKERIGLYKWRN